MCVCVCVCDSVCVRERERGREGERESVCVCVCVTGSQSDLFGGGGAWLYISGSFFLQIYPHVDSWGELVQLIGSREGRVRGRRGRGDAPSSGGEGVKRQRTHETDALGELTPPPPNPPP